MQCFLQQRNNVEYTSLSLTVSRPGKVAQNKTKSYSLVYPSNQRTVIGRLNIDSEKKQCRCCYIYSECFHPRYLHFRTLSLLFGKQRKICYKHFWITDTVVMKVSIQAYCYILCTPVVKVTYFL